MPLSLSVIVDHRAIQQLAHRLSEQQVRRRARAALTESLEYLRGEIRDGMSEDTGRSKESLVVDVRGRQLENLTGSVVSRGERVDAIMAMEYGRRPGATMPPPHVLSGWAGRHGIPTDEGTLYVLARAIGRKGIPARHMFEKAERAGRAVVERIFGKHFGSL